MSDPFSGVTSPPEAGGAAPLKPEPNTVALLALLAVVAAIAAALGRAPRRRIVNRLGAIAKDWERAGAGAALAEAARRFIRPALAYLREDEG